MDVADAVERRYSVRAFKPTPVPRETIETLLARAAQAPSGGNLQPWHVHVVDGARLAALKTLMAERIAANPFGETPHYPVYPPRLKEPYRTRRFRCGEALYASLGIAREDKPARLRQFARNYGFFGAPLALFFTIDRDMGPGQWSDLGMYIQTLMLLAVEQGLDTCAQESWAAWPETLGGFLALPETDMLFCGLACGERDGDHPVNGWRTERAPLNEWVIWHGDS